MSLDIKRKIQTSMLLLAGLTAMAGSAGAKSLTTKKCSHLTVSGQMTGSTVTPVQVKVVAIAHWKTNVASTHGSSYTNDKIALEKHYSCVPVKPKLMTCTFTARPCSIKKQVEYKATPDKPKLAPPIDRKKPSSQLRRKKKKKSAIRLRRNFSLSFGARRSSRRSVVKRSFNLR